MRGVLLLDVGCRPLRVISTQRAVSLLLTGRAEPMADEVVAEMRSELTTVSIPAVLRLGYAVKVPFAKMSVPCTRRGVLARDEHTCQFITSNGPCSDAGITIDHIHPKSKGGENMVWSNLAAACEKHNRVKGSRTLDELGWSLKREPVSPKAQLRLLSAKGECPVSWHPYLIGA